MNNQNILKYRGTKLDSKIDNSELYDFELVDNIIGKIDIKLDVSEVYDYKLGNALVDYIYVETFPINNYIITQDGFTIITQDGFIIEYNTI